MNGKKTGSNYRITPKEIKAWCVKTLLFYIRKYGYCTEHNDLEVLELMYKAYKRGYQDALGG